MTLLRRMAWAALVAGVAAGLLLAALQAVWVTPLIRQAETFEQAAAPPSVAAQGEPQGDGEPSDSALWAPAEGVQRVALTALSDVLAAVGFALLLVAGMTLRGGPTPVAAGLLWGVGGYAAFVLAPALGLPPELPGAAAGPLAARQLWWTGAVVTTAAGLAALAFAPRWLKPAGVVLLLAPHAVGAPPPPAETAEVLPAGLAAHFVAAVLVTSAVFWAVLGALCAWLLERNRAVD